MNKIVRPSTFSNAGTKKSATDFSADLHSTISYRALEPRIAFDGAAVATAAAAVDQQQADALTDGSGAPPADAGAVNAEAPADGLDSPVPDSHPPSDGGVDLSESLAVAIADISPPPQGQTVVFIDRAVENIDQIISSISPDSEIVLIDGQSGGLDQIAAHLSGRTNIDSVHIISHGEAGALYLGSETLNSSNLADHQAQLSLIGQSLSENGDILLYGCEIGSGTGGMDFVRAFADLTSADVAASTNDTGGDEAGGDWVLEATSGAIEASALSDPLYAGVLAKTNTGAWSIAGLVASNTTDGITTKVTFANGGASTWSTPTNDTLNNVAGGLLATTFDSAAVGGASLSTIWNSTNTTDVGTVTITFSTAVTNPILHLDRLGGTSGTSNSSLWTLATAGASLTKVSGVTHFLVDSAAGTITEQVGQTTTGSQSNVNIASGTSAGSVRINGTFTTITFNVRMNPGAGAGIGDGLELAFAIDAPPVAVNDTFTTAHDTPATIDVRINDSDIRGDAFNVTQVNGTAITAGGAGIAVTGGVVTLNVSGNLVFTPAANYLGLPSFTYTIADANGGTSTATVSGTVTNITPALDLDASGAGTGWSATFTENGSAVSIADIDAAIIDADDSNMESASVTLTNQQTGDRLLVNGSSAASGTLSSGITWTRTDTTVTLSGSFTKAQYTAALQLVQFQNTSETPAITPRIINTIVNDGHINSATAITTINIDRAPDPVNDAYSGNEDTAISGTVLTNDDLGDTPITSVTVATGPANGTLTSFNTATGAFVYTPGANFNGSDTFTYTVTDADGDTKTATVTITVNPVNDLPVAGNDTFTTVHDQPVTIAVLANDSDVETPVLTITQINGTAITVGGAGVFVTGGVVTLNAGGTLTFTPNADYAGSPTFTYTVADSNGATATATVSGTVTNVGPALDLDTSGAGTGWTTTFTENGPAVAIADLDAAIADSDDVNMKSSAITLTNPQSGDRLLVNGSSAASGTFASGITWTRTNSVVTLSGSFTKAQYAAALALIQFENTLETTVTTPRLVNVTVNDGTVNSNTAVATININLTPDPVNDAFSGNEDTAITGNVLANDTDLGTTPSIANPLAIDSAPSNGTLTSFNTATGAFNYTPNANFVGTDSFVYRYTDGNGDSKAATVTFTINAVDDIPFIDLNSEASPSDKDRGYVTEFSTGSGTPIAIASVDADIFEDGEDDVVKVTIIAGGTKLDGSDILTIAGQSFKLDADASFTGVTYGSRDLDITYTASTRTVTVTVSGDPTKPIPQVELDKLVREITYLNTSGTQPPSNRTFEFTVMDAGKNTSPAAIATVAFLPPPDAVDDTFTTAHDVPFEIDVRNNDKDFQGDPIFVTNVNGTAIISGGAGVSVAGGIVTLNASGNLVFTPTANYAGPTSFTYTIGDGTGGQDTATVTGTVTNVAPVLDLDASGADSGWTATYVENGAAVSIADVDSSVADADDTNMESATVTLTNPATGDRLLVNGSSATTGTIGGITWTRTNSTVTFSGTAASTAYAAALRAVQFENTTDTPSTTPRIINTVVNDGILNSNTAVTTINIDLTPDPVNDAFSGNEDQIGGIAGNVLTNDTDLGNTPITSVTVTTPPTNGTLTSFNTSTGAFVYTPLANFNGTETFTYTVTDADGDTKTATVTITVAPTNDAPVNTVPGAQTTNEDTPLSITGVSVNDVDGAGVPLTTTLSIPAGSGSLSIASLTGVTVTGAGTANMTISGTAAAINAAIASITYTPTADFNTGSPATPINLTVSTSDGIAPAVANTIAITVAPVADIAANSVTTNEDTPVTFSPLGNDTFENAGRTITAINGSAITAGGPSVVLAGVGTVALDALGSLTFTPVANYNGTPSFTYTVASGGVTETAIVNLTVNAINDAPTQTVPVAQTTNEDVTKVITGAAVADVDGGTITTTLTIPAGTGTLSVLTSGTAVIAGNGSGTVTISGTAAEINAAIASITYVPEADYNGPVSMGMSTTDGTATASANVAITVNPVADITIDAVTTNEDTARTFNVLTGTNGATADTFEGVEAVTGVTQPANGSVTFAADGTITYTPSANFNGTDTFTYTVTSGGVTETATVTVTVDAVNDAPVNSVPGAQTTSEDTGLVFSTANGNAIRIIDVDSNVTTTLTVANGALTLGSISGITVTGNGTGTVTVSGSPAAVTAALAGLTFAPTADFNGTTTLNVSTSDGVAPATVSSVGITVSPVADIAPNSVTTAEDTASTFNVLTNDNFENAGAIVSSVTQPANGSVTIGSGGNVTYTPALNYNGTDTFTYTVTSGGVTETTTVTMTVTPVNDAPKGITPFPRTSIDGATVTYNVGSNFSDVDGDVLTFSATGLPSGLSINPATGQISGTIDIHASTGGASGVYAVSVTAKDPSGALVTRTFNWTVTNPAPVAVNDSYTGNEDTAITGNVRTNDSDPDGDALTVNTTPVSGPSNGTLVLNSNGSFTYTPAANFTGTDTFTYRVADADGATSAATVTLYVNPVNDSPQNTMPGNQTTAEDTPLVFVGPNAISVSDVDSPVLSTTLSVAHGTLTLGSLSGVTVVGDGTGSVTLTGSPAAITAALSGLKYVNSPDYYGSDTLNVVSTDGIATTTANLALTVTPVADITADTVTANEDASISFNVLTGSNGATADTFEGSPAVSGFTQPANGTVTIDGSGNVVYTPNTNFNGTDTFSYTVTSGGVTETTTVTVNVTPVNDTPVLTVPAAQYGTEDTPVVFSGANANQIILGDVDAAAALTTTISVPAGTLSAIATPGVTIAGNGSGSVTLSGSPAAITAALNGLTYTPVADANGIVTMSVSTTDGIIAAPVTNSVVINLAPIADIQNDNASTSEDTGKIIAVLGNDSFENAGAAVTGVTNGANGTVTINGDGTVTYTPNANFNGSDSFTYTVTSGGVTETATVTVVVSPVNDAPVQTVPAAQVTAEDTGLSFSPATGNAITVADVDGDTLTTTVSVTNGTIDLGAFTGVTVSGNNTGIVTITGSAAAINAALDGLTYNPTPDYHGGAVLSVTTSDGAASASSTIALTVTPVTDIAADTISTNEDTPITINVMSNDSFENAAAAISAVTQPAHGTVSIGAGGLVTYTPSANYNGPDSFTYTVTSGGVSETTTVSVTVASINDAPVTSVPGGQTTNEDVPLVLSGAKAITVSDVDGDTLTVTLSGTNGILSLGSIAGVTVSGNGTGTVTVSGSAAAINAALNGLTFAPTADYNGTAAISVTTSDGTVTTSNTIGITVNPVVDIVADTVLTNEDVPVTFNVLTNDNFESAGKVVTGITQGASGTASFLADGTLIYTPNYNFHGTDTFTYTVTSGGVTETTTVTVTIGDVNDIPTTSGLADRSSLDGQAVSLNVAAVFADTDNAILTYSVTGLPPGLTLNPITGIISGTIDKSASQTGPYTVIVTASDGNPGGTVSASFTWNVSNPGPTAVNDVAATNEDTLVNIDVLVNDTDPDSDPLTVTAATAGNGTVTIRPDGTIDYTPNANFNGTDTIVYQISDGNGGVSTATVTVTIAPVNDAPTAITPLPNLIDTDSQSITLDFSGAFSDIDGDTLTYSITGLPPGLSFDTATGRITGTIAANASSPSGDEIYPISITGDDGHGGMVTTTFNWRIMNLPPASGDDAVTTPEDTPIVATVLSNDFDPDGDPLIITHINGTAISIGSPVTTQHGVVSLAKDAFGNQVLIYTPNANFNGVETIIYTTSDGNTGADTATLTITVTPVNDAPVAAALANLTNNDSDAISVDVSSFFSDIDTPEGDTLEFSAIGLPAGLAINPATGVISGTIDPSASKSGPYTVIVTGTDEGGATVSQTFIWTVNNPKPTAVNDAQTLAQGSNLAVDAVSGILSNDTDPDNDPLTVSAINGSAVAVGTSVTGSSGGLFTVQADGSYTFDQNGAFIDLQGGETRTTLISYTLSDGNGGLSTATLSITVTGVNDAPVATPLGAVSTIDNAPLTLNAAAAFTDADDDTLIFSATGLPAGLSIDPSTGLITGTIDKAASQGGAGGVYTVTIFADDQNGGVTPVTLTITITNPAPIAANDVAPVVEDTPVTGNVLGNDADPDGDTISVSEFTVAGVSGTFLPGDVAVIPGVGTIEIGSTGAYTFKPALNYNGPVPEITYTVSDGNGGTDTATINLGPVSPVNDDPESTPITAISNADSELVSVNLASNFADIDGDALTFDATGLPPGLSIDSDTGMITGTIDHLASAAGGTYSVTVTATDPDGKFTSQVFVWTVTNPAPIGPDIADAGGVDNTPVSIAAGSGFSDPDGDTIAFSATGLPSGLTINPVTGEISGILTKNASVGGPSSTGVYEITVTATDSQGATVSKTFTYVVTNPAPAAVNDAFSGIEDTPINGAAGGNDSDPDGDGLTYYLVSDPAHGTLTFNPDGTFTYAPNPDFNSNTGTDTFTYLVSDANGATTTATVTLTIAPVNDAPVAPNATESTPEDTPFNGTLTGTDVDGDTLTFSKASNPANGTVTVNPDGTYTYTPNTNFTGSDTFTYKVSDGNGGEIIRTVTINVVGLNDNPVAVNDAFTGNEDTNLTGDLTPGTAGQDSDIDGDTLVIFDVDGNAANGISPVTGPAHGTLVLNANGTFVYTPDANFNGTDSFTYRISDGNGGFAEATVSLTVNPVNDAPVADNETGTVIEDTTLTVPAATGLLAGDTDLDSDPLTITKFVIGTTTYPAGTTAILPSGSLTINSDGSYTFVPAANYNGAVPVATYTVSDGKGGSDAGTLTLGVSSVNDAPVADNEISATNEDTPLNIPAATGLLAGDTDVDHDTLTITQFTISGDPAIYTAGSTATIGSVGTLKINADGSYTFVPAANYNGPVPVATYTVVDGHGGSDTGSLTIAIAAVNDAPVAANTTLTTQEDKPFTGHLPVASDVDGDPVTYAKGSNPAHGTVVVNPDGTYVYKPAPDYFGPDTFTYTVSDGKGGVTTHTVTILVTPVNDAPVAKNDTGIVRPGSSVSVPVLGNDTDLDGDKLTVTKATAGQGTVRIMPDGSISYTPRPGFSGTDTITYIVSDGHGGFATATVTIAVEDAGYVDQPVVFGFDGPAISPDNDNGASPGGYPSIGAEGAIVDAVFDMGSLRSIANQLAAGGVVLSAANGPRSLGGIGSLGADGVITDTIRAERAREMLSYAGLDLRVFGGGIDGLTGFSLRNNVPGNLGGLGNSEQVIIESLVRNRTLIIQISNTIDPGTKRIVDYKITRADGTPLPEWLDRAGKDLLIGERAADEEFIQIRVEAVYTDGSIVVQDVQIETATGEIQPLKPGKQGSLAPTLFGDQFRARPMLTPDQIQSLGRAIAR